MHSNNAKAFLIHALFLSLTLSFIDVNTVAPAMLTQSGASTFHLGLLSAIMIGSSGFMQLLFAPLVLALKRKKPALLGGIYLRVASLFLLALFLLHSGEPANWKVYVILLLFVLFAFSGAFANLSYMDIMGSTIEKTQRKQLLTKRQLITSIGLVISSVVVKLVLSKLSYPRNYSLLFLLAAILLFFASSGFWILVEQGHRNALRPKLRANLFLTALKHDANLRLYLLLVNSAGIILTTIPFFVIFASRTYGLDSSRTGTFLLYQLAGSLIITTITNMYAKGQRYKRLLYSFILLGSSTPVVALLLISHLSWYPLVFLFGGAAISLYQILSTGILLEISNDENRPIYTGLGGAGSVMNLLYPLLAGLLIPVVGFTPVFLGSGLFMLLALYAAKHLDCEHLS
ncbi:MAG: MFS transporter [Sphaerochaeta sp.]|uniref:MFS transporter n=1 Tax=Sphaerochaeta sp. TaxID=1972642 RepID=UPI002FCB8369